MTVFSRSFAFALMLSAPLALPAAAGQQAPPSPGAAIPVQGDALDELDRKADELSETARRTIEEFVNLVGPILMRFSRLIDDLPAYEAPEVLPNGDIIIRRKPEPLSPPNKDTGKDGLTET